MNDRTKLIREYCYNYINELGWKIFPIHNIEEDGSCSCSDPECSNQGKHPRIYNFSESASNDRDQIDRWLDRWPNMNIGLPTGDICVIDVDSKLGRYYLMTVDNDLPFTRTSKSGSGVHYFYNAPKDVRITNKIKMLPGIDSRGRGGFVVLPPSNHINGNYYEWIDETSVKNAPEWWVDIFRRGVKNDEEIIVDPATIIRDRINDPTINAYGKKALEKEMVRLFSTKKGGRNNQLNNSAYTLFRLVAGGCLEESETFDMLLYAATKGMGLSRREAIGTISSGRRKGLLRPRRPR